MTTIQDIISSQFFFPMVGVALFGVALIVPYYFSKTNTPEKAPIVEKKIFEKDDIKDKDEIKENEELTDETLASCPQDDSVSVVDS